jgi:hypothetical protein
MSNAGMEGIENSPSTAFTVDFETGTVYVALFRQVFGSNDFGATWSLFFTGLPSEQINMLGLLSSPQSSAVSVKATSSLLVSASGIGVQKFSSKLQPPARGKATCALKMARNCTAQSKGAGRAICTLNGSYLYATSKSPIDARFRLERAASKKARKWTTVRTGRSGADGKVSLKVLRSHRLFYRLRFSSPACTTKVVEVKR